MPLQATSGAASYDAFGGGVAAVPQYIEDVFNVWVYPGSNSATSITNGIDLSGKGGLVWTKGRTGSADNHLLIDTVRGVNRPLRSNETGGQYTETTLTAFNANGYNITGGNGDINLLNRNYVSWTFREQAKFFDVVTYTGNSTSGRQIPHNLGSVPGCVIIKNTSQNGDEWQIWHKDTYNTNFNGFNTSEWANGGPSPAYGGTGSGTALGAQLVQSTSTVFQVSSGSAINQTGQTYVAYLFAHNAGGFGLTGTDNVISCGSYVTDGSFVGPNVNLGYEPQWILVKNSSGTGAWHIIDNMRGWESGGNVTLLNPNTSSAESTTTQFKLNATGFQDNGAFAGSATMIYIAIRRGPMKVPTTGTSVFAPIVRAGTTAVATITTVGFPPDLATTASRNTTGNRAWIDRLRGTLLELYPNDSSMETSSDGSLTSFNMNGVTLGADTSGGYWNTSPFTFVNYFFRRAPSFFDEVCYTGNGSGSRIISNNLGVAPEFIICKNRTSATNWIAYHTGLTVSNTVFLNSSAANLAANDNNGFVIPYNPPADFNAAVYAGISGVTAVNTTGDNYVMYLFASCPGVSKVFSFTGNGTTQTINCGFTGGARFVLLKATSTSGGWFVYDTARGMTVLTDPYLQLNSTAAEVATLGSVTTVATGFTVNAAVLAAVNTNGVSYIGLAIA